MPRWLYCMTMNPAQMPYESMHNLCHEALCILIEAGMPRPDGSRMRAATVAMKLIRQSTCSLRVSNIPAPFLPVLPWMLTSLSERLSWPCQSSPMAELLVGLAGLLSCCDMLHIKSPWKMAAVTRSGSWPRFSPTSSTAAYALVYCRPASPQPLSPQFTKRAAPLMPPTTGS